MEGLTIDDRVLVRAELVRVKQDKQAHDAAGRELYLQAARAIRKARELGVSMEEATSLAGLGARTNGYKLLDHLEKHERSERAA